MKSLVPEDITVIGVSDGEDMLELIDDGGNVFSVAKELWVGQKGCFPAKISAVKCDPNIIQILSVTPL